MSRNQGDGLIASGAGGNPPRALWGLTVLYSRLRAQVLSGTVADEQISQDLEYITTQRCLVEAHPPDPSLRRARLTQHPSRRTLCATGTTSAR